MILRSPSITKFKYLMISPLIPGWFSLVDMFLIKSILGKQKLEGIDGELVELGAYCGKSAIWIALCKQDSKPYLFDIFDGTADVHSSQVYKNLHESKLETWLARFRLECHILSKSSIELPSYFIGKKIQFIHIDASHLASDVLRDLLNAERCLMNGGFIVVDDWMNPSDPGVSKAVWNFLTNSKLTIAFCSSSKMYLTKNLDNCLWQPSDKFLKLKTVYLDYDTRINVYTLTDFVNIFSKFLSILSRIRVKTKG